MNEQDVIQGLKQGNRQAAEWLLDRFQRPLIRFFQVSLPDPESAPDAAQEVFLRLIQSLRGKKPVAVQSLQAYLFTIARRLMIDQVRESYHRPPMDSLDESRSQSQEGGGWSLLERIPDPHRDPREETDQRQKLRKVTEAIRSLDPEIREVTVLHHFEGLTGREIAAALNLKEGTVWSRLHQGLKILRKKLSPRNPSPTESPSRTRRETRNDP